MHASEMTMSGIDSGGQNGLFDPGMFKGDIRFDEPLSGHSSLRIGGTVDIMVFPEDPLSVKSVLYAADRENIPLFVLGGGTNILFYDGRIEGIALSLRAFRAIEPTKESSDRHVTLYVGSGTPLPMLVGFARKNGYSGIEALSGIPGYVGGAVCMNAGSFGTEISDVISSVAVMDRHGGITVLKKDELRFSYRRSNLPEGSVILGTNITLKRDDPVEVEARAREFLDRKKTTQPLGERSAGCVFRNPENDSAGRLIDRAGCKGMRIGDAEVSSIHANYFVNKGSATCSDFLKLVSEVKRKVKEYCGVELDTEVKIIGVKND